MVLYKRKPVQYVPRVLLYDDQEIWAIPETGELFTNYNDYLTRIEFYKQKRFISEITGHSQLNFFEALKNELEASHEVDDSFPLPLREPILRKVQHSTISRIDNLVDHVFDVGSGSNAAYDVMLTVLQAFKQDFFPGEDVTVIGGQGAALPTDADTSNRVFGQIREKIRFPELLRPDGTVERQAFARYFVSLKDRPEQEEAVSDGAHISRDRKTFTKQILRSYLKNALHREAWSGAPWQVKERLARDYRIPTEIPMHLTYDFQLAQRKANLTLKRGDYDGTLLHFFAPEQQFHDTKPKSQKAKMSAQDAMRSRQEQFLEYQRAMANDPTLTFGHGMPAPNDPQFMQFINQYPIYPMIAAKGPPKPPPPPAIKYPIEDLENAPQEDRQRPAMKYLTSSPTHPDLAPLPESRIHISTVGPLLETWDTLNVYCEVFLLDSFTFDDYLEALHFKSEEAQCELIEEIHCAVLKRLVNDEKDMNGQVQIHLPSTYQDESDEESSSSSATKSPTPEPEFKPRTTRSSLAKSEAAELKAAAAVDAKLHQGAEIDQCVKSYGWRARLRKRDFCNGRWIVIIVGMLNLFTSVPRLRKSCEEILVHLAPVKMEATEETAISQYALLDVNLRVNIIQFLCTLSLETSAIRGYMEECTISMTQFRKEKIEWQRDRKAALEELKALDEERRALQPESDSPAAELEALEELDGMDELEEELEDIKMDEGEGEDDEMDDSEDEDPIPQRSLRRANDRAADRKKRLEEDRKRKEKAEADKAKKPTKEARQLEKILRKIEDLKDSIKGYEEEMATCDNDLRESDCHRTRVLGKDRFWNRYYWFEKNAMPYAGLPTSSTASAGYANGCIWVQGPDEVERIGFIDLGEADNDQYRNAFQMSVPDRKLKDEGPTHTFTAYHWGYYDEPDDLDKLIGWLDVHGVREIKLRKELQAQRDKIVYHMNSRKKYLSGEGDRRSESSEPVKRVSTRTKTYVDPSGYRFLAWKNTTAMNELGHLHSEPPRISKRAAAKPAGKKEKPAEDEGRQTRASTSTAPAKMRTRQRTRYSS